MKKLDFAVLALAALLSLLPLLFLPQAGGEAFVTVTWHGEMLYSGRLSVNTAVTTPDGKNTVRIANGEAAMTHADCADGLCLRQGAARPGRPVVCLPNELVISVTAGKAGGEEEPFDVILH